MGPSTVSTIGNPAKMGTHLDTPPANGLRRRIALVFLLQVPLLLFHALGLLASETAPARTAVTSAIGVGRATSTGLTDKPNHVARDAPPAPPGLHGLADFAGDPLPRLEDAVL